MQMFKLSATPLENIDRKEGLLTPEAGALSTFEGWVRNTNQGHPVVALEYEAFETLTYKEAQGILEEARTKFDVLNVKCFHRVGRLSIGEMSVWVGVTAAHRDQAFKACRYIIDEIKIRLPIWKKEYYHNGNSGWVNSQAGGDSHSAFFPFPKESSVNQHNQKV